MLHCRKRVKTTSNYIFDTLFINGKNSDVTIIAFEKEWRLHRVYLSQATYFASMFSGSWKETSMDTVEMDFVDNNIDIESLQLAFESLYRDEVVIKPHNVINVLATSVFLGMVSTLYC